MHGQVDVYLNNQDNNPKVKVREEAKVTAKASQIQRNKKYQQSKVKIGNAITRRITAWKCHYGYLDKT